MGTLSTFGLHARYDLAEGFPAVTTKKLAWNVMASELLWFISGSDNINDLKAIYAKNKIWDANSTDYLKRLGLDANDGSMGRIYGTRTATRCAVLLGRDMTPTTRCRGSVVPSQRCDATDGGVAATAGSMSGPRVICCGAVGDRMQV